MCLVAFFDFTDILSSAFLVVAILVGAWAWKEDMNITYICWYGFLCFASAIVGALAFVGVIFSFSSIIVKSLIPISAVFGCILAWSLFDDYEATHYSQDLSASWLRALGLMKEPDQQPLLGGHNGLFGWGGKQHHHPYWNHGGDRPPSEGKGSWFGGSEGGFSRQTTPGVEAVPDHNVTFDPFMTR